VSPWSLTACLSYPRFLEDIQIEALPSPKHKVVKKQAGQLLGNLSIDKDQIGQNTNLSLSSHGQ